MFKTLFWVNQGDNFQISYLIHNKKPLLLLDFILINLYSY